ncbi:uncharacterized protein K452DRAFT_232126 [Aplosporella prunicola CBS 121167]|uniref:Rhodopsin domain-containing protein n=1 Tax=Aplosporella prunicola CBS 121167 TaxID=1176127 RepID=A0A6A6B796_9PEZI|nr:uncharacterized protein K452DRAFT_232126 [Aplosporella prunicola CBS 121167]KAF2139766.1 hypothetical protein K452DRAFT_232126 [Aplosporella prunicola CBS 121167]
MADSFTTEAFTLLSVGIVVIALRTTARITSVGVRGFHLDDYLILVAAVVYGLETAAAYIVGAWWFGLANNGMTDAERKALDPNSHEYYLRVGGSKTQLVGWSLYTLLLWLLKLCMCIFYSRLTAGLYLTRIRAGYIAIGLTYFATELSILLGCRPFQRNWQIYPDPGNYCQPAISKIDLYVTVVLNVVTDMYLMSIPLPMLWKANLPLRRKISLLVIFSGALFVMMAGVLRCALIIKDPINGAQAAGSWACRETFVAVVIGNVPMIYPLFRRVAERVTTNNSLLSRYYGKQLLDEENNSFPMKSSTGLRRARRRSLHHIGTTLNESAWEEEADLERGGHGHESSGGRWGGVGEKWRRRSSFRAEMGMLPRVMSITVTKEAVVRTEERAESSAGGGFGHHGEDGDGGSEKRLKLRESMEGDYSCSIERGCPLPLPK